MRRRGRLKVNDGPALCLDEPDTDLAASGDHSAVRQDLGRDLGMSQRVRDGVMISGEAPYLLERINYLADAPYAGRFDPNPMHAAEPQRLSPNATGPASWNGDVAEARNPGFRTCPAQPGRWGRRTICPKLHAKPHRLAQPWSYPLVSGR